MLFAFAYNLPKFWELEVIEFEILSTFILLQLLVDKYQNIEQLRFSDADDGDEIQHDERFRLFSPADNVQQVTANGSDIVFNWGPSLNAIFIQEIIPTPFRLNPIYVKVEINCKSPQSSLIIIFNIKLN